MAFTDFPGGPILFGVPFTSMQQAANLGTTTFGINDVDEKVAFVFQVPRDGVVERVWYRQAAGVAGTFTSRISLQDLDANGFPDGVADQFRLTGGTSASWVDSGIISSDGTDGGTKRTVTKGEFLAVVLDLTAYTSGTWNVEHRTSAPVLDFGPYVATANTVGAWGKVATGVPNIALQYTDGLEAIYGIEPLSVATSVTFGLNTTPDEVALRFQLDRAMRVGGAMFFMDADNAFDLELQTSGGAVLASKSFVALHRSDATIGWSILNLDDEVDLAAGTVYRMVLKPTTAGTILTWHVDVPANSDLAAFPGGVQFYYSQQTNSGGWSDTTTRRPYAGLIVRSMDVVGGGTGVQGSRIFTGF